MSLTQSVLKKDGKKILTKEKSKSVRFLDEDLTDEDNVKPRLFGTGEY